MSDIDILLERLDDKIGVAGDHAERARENGDHDSLLKANARKDALQDAYQEVLDVLQ